MATASRKKQLGAFYTPLLVTLAFKGDHKGMLLPENAPLKSV